MANEATIRTSLQIRNGNTFYQSQPIQFTADVSGTGGPSPGAISVSIAGVSVDFSQLTLPGLCRLQNLDDTNFIEYGIWDITSSLFIPLGEILPGESYVIRLSRNLGTDYAGSATGTGTDAEAHNLRLKANTAACIVLVEAFDR